MNAETTAGKYTTMRQMRGRGIAKTKAIMKEKNGWLVPSATDASKKYFVDGNFECDCPDAQFHKQPANTPLRSSISCKWR